MPKSGDGTGLLTSPFKDIPCPENIYLITFREFWAVCTLFTSCWNQNLV